MDAEHVKDVYINGLTNPTLRDKLTLFADHLSLQKLQAKAMYTQHMAKGASNTGGGKPTRPGGNT